MPKLIIDKVYACAQSEEKARVVSFFDIKEWSKRPEKTEMDEILYKLELNDSGLTEIRLNNQNQMKDNTLECLAVSLKKNTTLKRLVFTKVHINAKTAGILAEGLRENTSLIDLNFDLCAINDEVATILADAIKSNKKISLNILSMRGNHISDNGAIALSHVFKEIKSLTTLDLNLNEINDSGAIYLAESLKINSTLQTLALFLNKFGDAAVIKFISALELNRSIVELNLSNKSITNILLSSIKTASDRNRSFCEDYKTQLSSILDLHLNSIFTTKTPTQIMKDYCEGEFPPAQEQKKSVQP